jgi:hypothetical protein
MKSILVALIGISLILTSSCERHPAIRFGFDSQFDKNSNGLSIMAVNKAASSVYLYGNIEIDEGEIEVELLDPDGFVVYTIELHNQENLQVNKAFTALPGFWKLKYKSYDGKGNINLHLNY